MFDFFRSHTRLFFIILIPLIVASFVLVDTLGQQPGASQEVVAVVGRNEITQAELDRVFQQRVARVREYAPTMDTALLDTPELRRQVLDDLIRQRLLALAAVEFRVAVSDDRLRRVFATDAQFSSFRNTDGSINKQLIEGAYSRPVADFEADLRQSLAQQQLLRGLGQSNFAPLSVSNSAINTFFQQREVQVLRFNAKDYADQVRPTPQALDIFYKDPRVAAQFLVPEQVDLEYVTLDLAAIAQTIDVSEQDLKNYYNNNLTLYGAPPERRVSHILVAVQAQATPEVRAKARAKAESLLAQVRSKPESFEKLASQESEDAGSAKVGGDLGFFFKDQVVFGEALFALSAAAISDVIETEQGFHIIKMTDQRGGDVRSFETVRTEILDEVRKLQARSKFSDLSQEFSNLVFEQSDTFATVSQKWKLEVRTLKGLTRKGRPDPIFSHTGLLASLFDPVALQEKRNIPALEVGSSQMVSARVVRHTPARQPKLDEIQVALQSAYVSQASAALARKDGESQLAALQVKPPSSLNQKIEVVSRATPGSLSSPLLSRILSAPAITLPFVVGHNVNDQDYAIVLITKVLGADPIISSDPEAGRKEYAQAWETAEGQAYIEALKKRFQAKVQLTATS